MHMNSKILLLQLIIHNNGEIEEDVAIELKQID